MKLITIDMETFYSADYSLSKMTTEEYVNDPHFEVIGIGVKVGDQPAEWASGSHEAMQKWLDTFDWSDAAVLCHNTMFDGAILAWKFGVKPKAWFDTLCMGRALHGVEAGGSLSALAFRYGIGAKGTEVLAAKGKRRADFTEEELARYGDYCINDVELTHTLFRRMMKKFPPKELRVIDLTLRMFIEPALHLDLPLLESHLVDVKERKESLLAASGADKDDLMSNPKFAVLLESLGVKAPTKTSLTTGKETLAFAKSDEDFKALAEHPDIRVQALVAARLGAKSTLEETRTERFISIAKRMETLPVPIRYCAAHTTRFGGEDKINMQNLPARGANANKLKRAIIAPPGHVAIDADSAQIEARVLAWISGHTELVADFAAKRDVYKKMASAIYNKPVDEITKDERFVGKTTILGCGYGMGAVKFQGQLQTFNVDLDLDECRRVVSVYRQANNPVVQLWREAQYAIEALARKDDAPLGRDGVLKLVPDETAIQLPSGLMIRYDDLKAEPGEKGMEYSYITRKGRVRIYGGKCVGADTQVLTHRGWVAIVEIRSDDRLWDGVEWVKHDGLIYQGEKRTLVLDGVNMTPDHKVLTERGWLDASSCEGLHRAGFRLPDGNEVRGGEWAALSLGVQMPLRGLAGSDGVRRGEVRTAWRDAILRLWSWGEKHIARDVQASGVLGMAFDAGPLPTTYASGMGELRGSRDNGLRSLGRIVRQLLGGHGVDIRTGVDAGPGRQQRTLQPGELSVGELYGSSGQQAGGPARGYGQSPSVDRGAHLDAEFPLAPRAVYDIRNAGPRARFVVRGATGPFIVHNCVENFVQGVARCVISEQMLRVSKRYKVVLTVHDAITVVAPQAEADEARAYVEECMRWVPEWATGLPVDCESGMAQSYGDC